MEIQASQYDAFPSPIWTFHFDPLIEKHEEWLALCQALRENDDQPNKYSNRNGWNTHGKGLFREQKALAPLAKLARAAFQHSLHTISRLERINFALEGWFNVTDPGGYNIRHAHPRVLMSGCYYLKVPEKSGNIVFSDPRPGAVHAPMVMSKPPMMHEVTIAPKEGQMLVFPAWLDHRVEENEASESRVSIAMNANSHRAPPKQPTQGRPPAQ